MSRLKFDIKFRPQIESGEYKVETRDGRPARIICYNRKFGNQLVALATEADGRESYISCNSDGKVNLINECSSDLFIVTPDEELTEFEKAFLERVFHQKAEDLDEENREIFREDARCVLELARKQLQQEIKAEVLKDLPRWRKCGKDTMRTFGDEHFEYRGECFIVMKHHEILLSDLEKLPGFNESILVEKKDNYTKMALLDCSTCRNYHDPCNPENGLFACNLPSRDPNNKFPEDGVEKQEQKPAEWSEEDKRTISEVIQLIEDGALDRGEKDFYIDRLKSLSPQPKQKWSQEDNDFADDAIACVTRCYEKYIDNKEFYQSLRHNTMDIKRWLIKVRKRLTPQWKPSEEQLEAARYVSQFDYGGHKAALVSLYEQLKKL